MPRFLAERVAQLILLVALAGLLTFVGGAWAPGGDEDDLQLEPAYSKATIAGIRVRQDRDRPALERFGRWLGSVARGGLGVSSEYGTPVLPLVAARAARTLLLALVATSMAWLVALPLGVLMAARAGSAFDRWCRAALVVVLALPDAILAIVLMLLAAYTGWLPAGGMLSARLEDDVTWLATAADLARHLVLPAVALGLGLLPPIVRHVRSSLAGVLVAPFVLAARGRGVPEHRLLFRLALRVAAAPLVSLLGLSVAGLLSASLLVEVVTGWPGLGPLLVEATRSRDLPVVAGATVCSIALLMLGTTLTELLATLADARVRLAGEVPHE